MGFTVDRTIPRQVEDVWRIMTDWKIAEYWLGVNRLRLANAEQAPKQGSKLTYMVRGEPQPMEITAWKKHERLGLSSRQGGIVVTYDYEFSTVEAGTRIQLTSSCVGGNWFWRAIAPLLEWTMRVADRKQLQALDNLVRATTGSGT
jgi:uncharacterized protein YndB with AHSA1/START domain